MATSAIYILDLKGKSLICRNYRGDIENNAIEKFLPLLMDREEESYSTPIIRQGTVLNLFNCNFTWVHLSSHSFYEQLTISSKSVQD